MAEVGSGQVAIFPTFKGFRSQVNSEVSGAGREGGKTFSSAFSSGAGDPGAALVKKLNAQIASGAKAMSAARLAEQDAAGKVRVAEAALAEARAKSGENSARALAAEERLASAQRKSAEASARANAATDQLRQSQSQLADATTAAAAWGERGSSRYASGWSSLRQKLSGIVKGSVDSAGASAEAAADSAGKSAGNAFGSGFKALVGPAIALAGAIGFSGFIGEAARASDATDKFKATMNFAGLDSSAITDATNAAKEFADQTVYDLPTIQNTIAQLASNGVADYTGLTKAAGNLNAVAGGNADTFKSVAMVMTQTAGAGKLTTENWNQMADAIPGAAGPLMRSLEEAGAYTGNFRDAMAAGEITADEFNAALMKLGNDPVAVEAAKSTKTFEGALGGLQATINSGLMRALDNLKPAITGAMNFLSAGLGKTFDFIGQAWTGLGDLFVKGDFTGALGQAFGIEEDSPVVGWMFGIRNAVVAGLQGISDFVSGFTMPLDLAEQFAGEFNFMQSLGITFRDAFGQIASAVGPLIPDMIALWQATSPLQIVFAAIQPLLPQLLDMFGQLASIIGQSLMTVLTTLVPLMVQLSGTISQALGGVLAAVLPTIVTLITMLGTTLSQLLPIVMPIIATLLQMAAVLIGQLAPIIAQLVSSILPPVISIFGLVLGAIGPVIQMLAGLLIPIIQALLPVVVTVFGVVADVISSAMQIIQGIIQVVTGIISGNWSQVWQGIGNILGGVWNLIVSLIKGALQTVGTVVMAGLGLVGRFFSDAWRNVTSGVSGFIGDLLGFFGSLPGRILSALGNLGSLLLNAGQALIQGFIDGIKGMVGAIGDAVGGVLDFAKQFFPHSPAKRGPFSGRGYTSYSGEALARDFAGGIDSEQRTVAESAARLMSSAQLNMRAGNVSADITGSGLAGVGGGNVTYNTTINQVDDPLGTAAAVQRRLRKLAV